MSDLTYQQALDLLQADPAQFNSLQSLSDLAARVNVDAVGDVSILYGGKPANGIEPQQIFDAMKLNGDSIRILDDTDAATFLGSDAFRVAWASQFGLSQADLDVQPELLPPAKKQALVEMNNSLFHATDGPWAEASGRFVDATVGEIRTLTGGAAADRTFALVEVPRALANNNITHIDGIARADLVEVGAENAFKAISAQSDVYSAELKIATQADGSVFRDPDGRIRLDSQDYFGTTGLDGKPPLVDVGSYKNLGVLMPDRLSQHAAGADVLQDIYAKHEALSKTPDLPGVDNAALRASALRALDKLGWAGDLLALGLVAKEANAAYAAGDSAEGNRLLGEWAANFAGGLAGGLAAAKLVGAALAPLYMVGPAGAVIAGGLTLLAGLVGGIFGGEALEAFFSKATITQTRRLFSEAQYSSPLILDLDGDGVVQTRALGEGAYFDHDGNGLAESTGWVGAGDALLVRDLNGNGRIDGGAELFGNRTAVGTGSAAHGFAALAALDGNADGQLDAQDSAWASLLLWKDLNGDGRTDAGELITLGDAGVSALGTAYSSSTAIDAQGNQHRQIGGFARSDGSTGAMQDVWFSSDAVISRDADPIEVSQAIAALPDMQGLGLVRSLHQAMARDASGNLQSLVQAFVAGDGQGGPGTLTQLEAVLNAWTGADQIADGMRGTVKARRLAVLEAFMAQPYVVAGFGITMPSWPVQTDQLNQAYEALLGDLYDKLMAQSHFKPLFDALGLVFDETDGALALDVQATRALLASQHAVAPAGTEALMAAWGQHLMRQGAFGREVFEALSTTGVVDGTAFEQAIARLGFVHLSGMAAADALNAAAAASWLKGGEGDDTYVFTRGDGHDFIIDSWRELFRNNTLLVNGQKATDSYAALCELDGNCDAGELFSPDAVE